MGHALPRRISAVMAGACLSAAMLTACGGGEEPPTTDEQVTEDAPAEGSDDGGSAETDDSLDDDAEGDGDTDDGTEDDGTGDDDADDDPADDDSSDDATEGDDGADDGGDDGAGSTNLFEGSWGFGHDTKVLSAEELADLLEEKAEELGPDEMSLDVECESGIDTGAGQTEADCTAFADEGVEHVWHVTAAPADAGLEVEVENAG
ncbi:MAG TPA: hypothetical protein H9837_12935 [Candidatus Brachybacterium merdigallinarum]|nr:hypothetical protein [Candidatus Brachybacterium merdigallinarum]